MGTLINCYGFFLMLSVLILHYYFTKNKEKKRSSETCCCSELQLYLTLTCNRSGPAGCSQHWNTREQQVNEGTPVPQTGNGSSEVGTSAKQLRNGRNQLPWRYSQPKATSLRRTMLPSQPPPLSSTCRIWLWARQLHVHVLMSACRHADACPAAAGMQGLPSQMWGKV